MGDNVEEPSIDAQLAEAESELLGEESPQYASEEDEERKKKKRRRRIAAISGLAALVLGAGLFRCTPSVIDRFRPDETEEPMRTAYVEETEDPVEPTSPPPVVTEEKEIEPIITEEPVDVREGWYGNYEGIVTGRCISEYRGDTIVNEFSEEFLWVEIYSEEVCHILGDCDETANRYWGFDVSFVGPTAASSWVNVRLFLPDNLEDTPGLQVSEDTIIITPTAGHDYEVMLEKIDGQLKGYVMSHEAEADLTETWILESFTAEQTTAPHPSLR